jgi:hypothetical protein
MSTEPDYDFTETTSTVSADHYSLHIPFALLTATLAVIMIMQTVNTFKTRDGLREAKVQLAEAYRTREPVVKQSAELQSKLQALVLDLLLLSKTDDDAKAIVGKYNIQQNAPAGADADAPAAAPAP